MACKIPSDECLMYCAHKENPESCPNYKSELTDKPTSLTTPVQPNQPQENTSNQSSPEEIIPERIDHILKKNEEETNPITAIYSEKGETEKNTGSNKAEDENSRETGDIRDVEYKVGPGCPPKDKQFTSENQPPGELKSAGWKKKKFTRDTIRAMLDLPFKGSKDLDWYKKLVEIFGEEALEGITMGQLMTLRQQQVASENGSTPAYSALIDQSMGRPVQALAQTDVNGNDLPPIALKLPPGMSISFPKNTE